MGDAFLLVTVPTGTSLVAARAVVPYGTPFVLVALAFLLFFAWKRGRLVHAFMAIAVALALVWGVALLAIWTDYRDADGFTDCWPTCSHYQNAVASAFWYAPLTILVLGVFTAVLGSLTARRKGRGGWVRRSG